MENATREPIKKYQGLIFPAVAIIIGLVLLGLIIIPQGLKIPETNNQINQVRKSVNLLNQKIGQLSAVDVNQYEQDLKSSLVSLPEEKDIPLAMALIFNLLRNNSLVLNSINFPSSATEVNSVNVFLIKVDVSGPRDGLTNLIAQLKESPRVLKVESISTATMSEETTMQILIGLNTFYQPLPKSQVLELEKEIELPTVKNKETLQTIKDYYARSLNLTVEATTGATVFGKVDPFQ